MSEYRGTMQELHKDLGPRLRNIITTKTRPVKKNIKQCEICKCQKELQAAHLHENGRKDIIFDIAKQYMNNNGIVQFNNDEFDRKFIEAHEPFDETVFKFLCADCHREYDKSEKEPVQLKNNKEKNSIKLEREEFEFIDTENLLNKKVGIIAQEDLKCFLKSNKCNDSLISFLQDKQYSKNIFGMNYPILSKLDKNNLNEEIKRKKYDHKGRSRYYTDLLQINNELYLLVSQWNEYPHKNKLIRFLYEHKFNL